MNEFKFFTTFSLASSLIFTAYLLGIFIYGKTLAENYPWAILGFFTIYSFSKLIEAQD